MLNNATGEQVNRTDYQYKMGENNLEESTSEKDLGVYIDNKLRLSDHVDAAVNKANRLTSGTY